MVASMDVRTADKRDVRKVDMKVESRVVMLASSKAAPRAVCSAVDLVGRRAGMMVA